MPAKNPINTLIFDVCELLDHLGGEATLADVATALSVDPDKVRAEVKRYSDIEVTPGYEPAYLQLLDPAECQEYGVREVTIKMHGSMEDLLGACHYDATVYGPLLKSAIRLSGEEPDNEALAEAISILRDNFLPGIKYSRDFKSDVRAKLKQAIDQRAKVKIEYSNLWSPKHSERVVEPYQLEESPEGYEVFCGPIVDGETRCFLVARIKSIEVLDETFDVPAVVPALIEASRRRVQVHGDVPHDRTWLINKFGTNTKFNYTEEYVEFWTDVREPIMDRTAMMMLLAGAEACLYDPEYDMASAHLAKELLEHHGL